MGNSSENKKVSNVSGGMKVALNCLCKNPIDFFAQAMDGLWLSTLGYCVEVSESHRRKCKDCAKLVAIGLLALACAGAAIGIKSCRNTKTSAQQTSNILSNQGR